MFLGKKEKIVNIKDIVITYRYPTITDEISIESKKALLTRGQYTILSISLDPIQRKATELTDAIATLSICAIFENKKYYWEGFTDEDGKDFILEVYKDFNLWRLQFRNDGGKNSGEGS